MVHLRNLRLLLVLALGDIARSLSNTSVVERSNATTQGTRTRMRLDEWLAAKRMRRQGQDDQSRSQQDDALDVPRSTSSDSGMDRTKENDKYSDKDSMQLSDSSRFEETTERDPMAITTRKGNKHMPQSTEERKGWRKWHRKCKPCPEEAQLKWRSPNIKWICGAYQRARRSFKSICMMQYRNCQDGTMFVKIKDHKCDENVVGRGGKHFFYDYKVHLSEETVSVSSDSDSHQEYTDTERRRRNLRRHNDLPIHTIIETIIAQFENGTTNETLNAQLKDLLGNVLALSDNETILFLNDTDSGIVAVSNRTFTTPHTAETRASLNNLEEAIRAVSDFGLSLAAAHTRVRTEPVATTVEIDAYRENSKTALPNRTDNMHTESIPYTTLHV